MKKKLIIVACLFLTAAMFSSCRTAFVGNYATLNNSLSFGRTSTPNFKNLGTFYGIGTALVTRVNISNDQGLVAEARVNLMNNIQAAGINMNEGSKMLVNINIEKMQTKHRVTVTISAEVIEVLNQ